MALHRVFNVIFRYGNHDFGNNDPHAFCPHLYPRKMVHGQPYSSHQLNRDKFPDRPQFTDKYWLPDYNYHYEIPEADLEVIVPLRLIVFICHQLLLKGGRTDLTRLLMLLHINYMCGWSLSYLLLWYLCCLQCNAWNDSSFTIHFCMA